MAETLSVRVPEAELKEIELLSRQGQKKKAEILREVLRLGIQSKKPNIAIEKFRNDEATASKAAKMAGIPLTRFLDILAERKIDVHYGAKELRDDLEGLA